MRPPRELDEDIDNLVKAVIDLINKTFTGKGYSEAEGVYVAGSALGEAAATVLFNRIPLDSNGIDVADRVIEGFCEYVRSQCEEIIEHRQAERGLDTASKPLSKSVWEGSMYD